MEVKRLARCAPLSGSLVLVLMTVTVAPGYSLVNQNFAVDKTAQRASAKGPHRRAVGEVERGPGRPSRVSSSLSPRSRVDCGDELCGPRRLVRPVHGSLLCSARVRVRGPRRRCRPASGCWMSAVVLERSRPRWSSASVRARLRRSIHRSRSSPRLSSVIPASSSASRSRGTPFPGHRVRRTLAQLVVHLMEDPAAGLAEMVRVTRKDGVVAACVWDHAGGRGPVSPYWDAVRELDPDVVDESHLAGARESHLAELIQAAACTRSRRHTSSTRRASEFRGVVGADDARRRPGRQLRRRARSGTTGRVRERCREKLPTHRSC